MDLFVNLFDEERLLDDNLGHSLLGRGSSLALEFGKVGRERDELELKGGGSSVDVVDRRDRTSSATTVEGAAVLLSKTGRRRECQRPRDPESGTEKTLTWTGTAAHQHCSTTRALRTFSWVLGRNDVLDDDYLRLSGPPAVLAGGDARRGSRVASTRSTGANSKATGRHSPPVSLFLLHTMTLYRLPGWTRLLLTRNREKSGRVSAVGMRIRATLGKLRPPATPLWVNFDRLKNGSMISSAV